MGRTAQVPEACNEAVLVSARRILFTVHSQFGEGVGTRTKCPCRGHALEQGGQGPGPAPPGPVRFWQPGTGGSGDL